MTSRKRLVSESSRGSSAVTNSRLPQIVYLAYPRSDYLIEVYDRAAQRARSLVTSGQVGPVR